MSRRIGAKMFIHYEYFGGTMDDPALPLLRDAQNLLITMDEAAQKLGITRRALEGLTARGRLTKLHFKGHTYLASYEVDIYLFNKKRKKKMLQSDENQFQGINPHLMSFLQIPGSGASTSTYPSFHKDHITHIKDFLNDYLPAQYIALTEPSIQIQGRKDILSPFQKDSQPSPDVTVYHLPERPKTSSLSKSPTTPSLELELILEEQRMWTNVTIYERKTIDHTSHGTPIVRIELLSPANMLGGSYDDVYQQNRVVCFLAGTPLIEIDYLHEYDSPVKGVPLYPTEDGSKPYNISVTHPQEKRIEVYLFGINEAIPTVTIPLIGDDKLDFDFGEPYAFTWKKSRLWYYVDYEQEPLRMERYSPPDQDAIRQHMQVIAQRLQP
jgi:Protein of unknown function (DUF4058)